MTRLLANPLVTYVLGFTWGILIGTTVTLLLIH